MSIFNFCFVKVLMPTSVDSVCFIPTF